MDKLLLEARILAIVDAVKKRQPTEDAYVELKSEWSLITPERTARRLGALCNSAFGHPVLWLVGIDEKAGCVVGAGDVELPKWQQAVERQFDGSAPELLTDINVAVEGGVVKALLFASDRAPYVVKNPKFNVAGGQGEGVALEVPWRDGTMVRSARREDLIRLLAHQRRRPRLQLRSCVSRWYDRQNSPYNKQLIDTSLTIFVVPFSGTPVHIPFFQTAFSIVSDEAGAKSVPLSYLGRIPSQELDPAVKVSEHQVLAVGAGFCELHARHDWQAGYGAASLECELSIQALDQPTPSCIRFSLNRAYDKGPHAWELSKPTDWF